MNWIKKMVLNMTPPDVENAFAMTSGAILSRPDTFIVNALAVIRYLMFNPLESKLSKIKTSTVKTARCIPLVKSSTIVPENYSSRLMGKSVLCVGGQFQLYPAYQQIVEDAGGRFLSFYGAADAVLADLDALLNDADLVIYPIDCIRHDVFFKTKHYCEYSGKPCVLLDKARITAFYNGIRVLKQLATV